MNTRLKELLSSEIGHDCQSFLEILETFDESIPTKAEALIVKQAMSFHKDSVASFQLKKSLRIALFKLKNSTFKISLAGVEKLLNSPDRLDDLALAVTTVDKAEAFIVSDYFKSANWKNFPQEVLPCFCLYFKKHGNSQDLDDLLELTRHPHPLVVAAALEALKKLDTGSLRSVIEPLLAKNAEEKNTKALEQLVVKNINYDSSNISKESKEYFDENHELIINSLKNGTSELETIRILRLIKKYGDYDDGDYVKPLLKSESPDIVRATMKVLEKLDKDYLFVYLPQLLQDKNAKIRMTATRVFQTLDKESLTSIVLGLITSTNLKQRSIGITTAMLVDFNTIRSAYLMAFANETSSELLEKIGLVIGANPDANLVNELYLWHKQSKSQLISQRLGIINSVAEKVSIATGGSMKPQDLITKAEEEYNAKKKASEESATLNSAVNQISSNNESVIKGSGFYKNMKPKPVNTPDKEPEKRTIIQEESHLETFKKLSFKGKLNALIVLCVVIAWALLAVVLLMKVFY